MTEQEFDILYKMCYNAIFDIATAEVWKWKFGIGWFGRTYFVVNPEIRDVARKEYDNIMSYVKEYGDTEFQVNPIKIKDIKSTVSLLRRISTASLYHYGLCEDAMCDADDTVYLARDFLKKLKNHIS